MSISVREARSEDAEGIAALALQLGYSVSGDVMRVRLEEAAKRPQETIIVALDDATSVVGWCTLDTIRYIHVDPFAEITGFVVDERMRKKGIGSLMVAEAERWTKSRGLPGIYLHTNVVRTEAHRFYEANGFTRMKQQYVYMKEMR